MLKKTVLMNMRKHFLFCLTFSSITLLGTSCKVDLTKDLDEIVAEQTAEKPIAQPSVSAPTYPAPAALPQQAPTTSGNESLPVPLPAKNSASDTISGNPMLNVPTFNYVNLPQNSLPLFSKSCLLEKDPSKCSSEAIQKWFNKNLSRLLEESANGTAYVEYISFTIDENGRVTNVSHAGTSGTYSQERAEVAVKAIQKMPAWIPGMRNGKPVRTPVVLPVKIHVI